MSGTAQDLWLALASSGTHLVCEECQDRCGTAYGYGHWESHGVRGMEAVDDGVLCASCVRQRVIQWALTTPETALDGFAFERLWLMEA